MSFDFHIVHFPHHNLALVHLLSIIMDSTQEQTVFLE